MTYTPEQQRYHVQSFALRLQYDRGDNVKIGQGMIECVQGCWRRGELTGDVQAIMRAYPRDFPLTAEKVSE